MVGVIHTQIRQIKWTNCLSGLYGCRKTPAANHEIKYIITIMLVSKAFFYDYNMIEMMTNRSVKTNQPTNQTNKKT